MRREDVTNMEVVCRSKFKSIILILAWEETEENQKYLKILGI